MAIQHSIASLGLLFGFLLTIHAQGFLNLGFESNPILVGPDPNIFGSDYSIPHWTVYYNGTPQNGVLINNYILDYTTAALFVGSSAIDGDQSVFLAASSYEAPVGGVSTESISQSGVIPISANSIQFELGSIDAFGNGINTSLPQNNFFVTVNGQIVPLQIISNGGSFLTLGGNVSRWAGQTAQLSIGVTVPFNSANPGEILFSGVIDSVAFSSNPVPEPSAFALAMLDVGAALLILHRKI